MMQSFTPVYDARTRILIVGSFPGKESLRKQQYYGHPQNKFWRILSDVLGENLTDASYKERLRLILEHGIGLWDTIHSCERKSSLDQNITNQQYNDFSTFSEHIERFVCNGNCARKFIEHCSVPEHAEIVKVPSTSPANAGIPYAEKIRHWTTALKRK